MQCEKATQLFVDELYDELDEVTRAALRKHCEECASCGPALDDLRGTQGLFRSALTTQAPDTLEDAIMARVSALDGFPKSSSEPRVGRVISMLGRWAMKPQTAMAAVFLLMVGSSALLIKGRREHAPASVEVSEHGTPTRSAASPLASQALEEDSLDDYARGRRMTQPAVAAPAATMAQGGGASGTGELRLGLAGPSGGAVPPPAAAPVARAARSLDESNASDKKAERESAPVESRKDSAMNAYKAKNYDDAVSDFDSLARAGDPDSALWAARAVRDKHGCASALTRYDQLASSAFGTPAGYEATLEGGQCYRRQGFLEAASSRFQRLLTVPAYATRAQSEIDEVHRIAEARAKEAKARAESANGGVGGAAAKAPAKPAAPATVATGKAGAEGL